MADKLTPEQNQLLLSSRVGDGYIRNGRVQFSCIYKDYMQLKHSILYNLDQKSEVKLIPNPGFKKDGQIYTLGVKNYLFNPIENMPIDKVINSLDEVGMAFWAYDDCSLHYKNLFYNLNSHALSYEIQQDILIPKLKSLGISGAKITSETKADGRKFYYINIPKLKGGYEFDEILRKYDVPSYRYKLLPDKYKSVYTSLKSEYAGCKISQMSLSKVIKGIMEEDTTLKDRLTIKDDILTYSKFKPYKLQESELVYL